MLRLNLYVDYIFGLFSLWSFDEFFGSADVTMTVNERIVNGAVRWIDNE
jgi:hypothetical protein